MGLAGGGAPGAARPDVPGATGGAVEAVVVDYHSEEALARCVTSLLNEGARRVVVVDNSLAGASARALCRPEGRAAAGTFDGRVEVLDSARNGGFGAGVNLGVARTSAAAILACNPDVELCPGALAAMLAALGPDVGVVAPRLLDQDGRERPGARPLPSPAAAGLHAFVGLVAPRSARARAYRQRQRQLVASGRSSWVPGTCMLFSRRAFEQVGGFDEAFFLYLEEVDLCRRLGEAGWRVVEQREAAAVHAGATSTSRRPRRAVLAYHASLFRYTRRVLHGPERLLLPLAAAAIATRCALALVLVSFRSPLGVLAAPPR